MNLVVDENWENKVPLEVTQGRLISTDTSPLNQKS